MIERGIIVAGFVLPGTDWCLRDSTTWFELGTRGTRKRTEVVDLLCGHWTGGEASVACYDDDGPFVVRNMRARVSAKTGKPLDVGIDFIIGACAENDEFSPVWQSSDPANVATVHVGYRPVIKRSIGVEVVNVGRANAILPKRRREVVAARVLGKPMLLANFQRGQINSWVRLARALSELEGPGATHLHTAGIRIPRCVPVTSSGLSLAQVRRFTRPEVARYAGAIEHLLVPGTTKLDAGGLLLGALSEFGWASKVV